MARGLEILCVFCVFVTGLSHLTLAVTIQGYKQIPVGGWLHLHTANTTWTEARLQCESEGGILASPTSHSINNAMKKTMAEDHIWTVFTGLHASTTKGDFVSIDGMPLANCPAPWARGEPNGWSDDEDCLALSRAGEVADVSCSSARPYLCFKSDAAMQDSVCGAGNGYTLDRRTGSCYKFYRYGVSWPRAAMKCASDRAYLAVINSNEESQVIRELFAQNPASTITGDYDHVAHIGFIDWNNGDNWLTVFGQTFSEAGFGQWDDGEPNHVRGIEHCGSVSRNGKFNDSPCLEKMMPYICEITPPGLGD